MRLGMAKPLEEEPSSLQELKAEIQGWMVKIKDSLMLQPLTACPAPITYDGRTISMQHLNLEHNAKNVRQKYLQKFCTDSGSAAAAVLPAQLCFET